MISPMELEPNTGRIGIVADAAMDLIREIDAGKFVPYSADTAATLPAELMSGFEDENDSQAKAVYLGNQARLILELVELQNPSVVNHGFFVERLIRGYDQVHGVQPWTWVETVVDTALPTDYELRYGATMARLAGMGGPEREGQAPQPTKFVQELAGVGYGVRNTRITRWAARLLDLPVAR